VFVPELFTDFGTCDLRGAEVWIDGDVPGIKEPFWDVASVPVPPAPGAELIREYIIFWGQSQLPDL